MLKLILNQYLLSLISFYIIYCIGKVIISFFKVRNLNFYFSLFLTNLIGLIVLIFLYSVTQSNFKTINILLIPFFLLFSIHFRKYFVFRSPAYKVVLKEILFLTVIISCFFLYHLLFIIDFDSLALKSTFPDYSCYASYSENLKINGFESILSEMSFVFPDSYDGTSPYHYSELWLNAFYSEIFRNSTLNSYYFTVIPLLLSVYFIGLYSIIKIKLVNVNKYYQILLAVLLLFITSIFDPFHHQFFFKNYPFISNFSIMGFGQKLIFVYLFLLLGLHLLMSGNNKIGSSVILMVPIFSVSFLPGIYGGGLLYLFLLFIQNKFVLNKRGLKFVIFIVFLLILYYLFYKFNSNILTNDALDNSTSGSIVSRLPNDLQNGFSFINLKLFFANLITYYFPALFHHLFYHLKDLWIGFLFFFPFFILLFSVCKNYKSVFFLIFCIFITGSISLVMIDGMLNSAQFLTNLSAFFSIFIMLLHIEFYKISNFSLLRNKIIIFFLFSLQIFFCAYPTIVEKVKSSRKSNNRTFINKIAAELKEEKIIILEFYSTKDFQPLLYENWINSNDLKMLNQITNKTIFYLLGNPEVYLMKNKLAHESKVLYSYGTPINYWYALSRKNNLESFVKKFNIRYCYFKRGVKVPLFIENNVKKMLEDQFQNKFYILN